MAKKANLTVRLTKDVPNPFRCVGDMCAKLNIEQSKYALGWRLTEYKLGAIYGLPLSRGRIVASDGLSCIIITETGFYIGHHAWFVEEKKPVIRVHCSSAKETSKSVSIKKQAILDELKALLD